MSVRMELNLSCPQSLAFRSPNSAPPSWMPTQSNEVACFSKSTRAHTRHLCTAWIQASPPKAPERSRPYLDPVRSLYRRSVCLRLRLLLVGRKRLRLPVPVTNQGRLVKIRLLQYHPQLPSRVAPLQAQRRRRPGRRLLRVHHYPSIRLCRMQWTLQFVTRWSE